MESMPRVSESKWRDTEAETVAATTAAQERCTMPPGAECGKTCQVPFKPDGSRPVYCSDCYQMHNPARPARRY
jgi:CxxC-x17-CxxC domain-containing protein